MSLIPLAEEIPELPDFFPAVQQFDDTRCEDVGGEVYRQLEAAELPLSAGQTVAISVGSRGIANLAVAVKAAADWVKSRGAAPFLVPAMGSHGGGTAEGQRAVIEGYGVTEEAVGCEIRSSMEVVELPQGEAEVPVYFDRHAAGADHTLVLNRIKIHTDFHGPYESGLMKMMAIGLGKQAQAMEIHRHGVRGMRDIMPQVARQVLKHGNVLAGIGLIENACEHTAEVHVIPACQIEKRELELIERSRRLMPRLPVDEIDILIVDEIGKNISGVCMDTNIIGRLYVDGQEEPATPRINKIMARALTEATHGNCLGVGLADVITRRLADEIDWPATYENIFTSTFVRRGFLPIVMETDAQALGFCKRVVRAIPTENLRIMRIRNTLEIRDLLVSEPIARELRGRGDVRVGPNPVALFDGTPEMVDFSKISK
jgi:hypothetical protein